MPHLHRERYRGFDLSFSKRFGVWTGNGTCRKRRFAFATPVPELSLAVARAKASIDAHYECEAQEHCDELLNAGTVTLKL